MERQVYSVSSLNIRWLGDRISLTLLNAFWHLQWHGTLFCGESAKSLVQISRSVNACIIQAVWTDFAIVISGSKLVTIPICNRKYIRVWKIAMIPKPYVETLCMVRLVRIYLGCRSLVVRDFLTEKIIHFKAILELSYFETLMIMPKWPWSAICHFSK